MNIYDINSKYLTLEQLLIDSDGELTEELQQELEQDAQDIREKYRAYHAIIKKFEGESDTLDKEVKRLQARKKTRDKAIERLKENLKDSMLLRGEDKFEDDLFTISFRKSESVNVFDLEMIPAEFTRTKVEPDKTLIKEALKSGEDVPGAVIEVNQNLQIK